MWAIMCAYFTYVYCLYIFLTWLPSYLVDARGFTLLKVGFLASLPLFAMVIGDTVGGLATDWLLKKTAAWSPLSACWVAFRGGITKAGNGRARRILVEAAWSYRYPPRVSREKQMKVAAAPRAVREIAWKAQMRLCGRFRSLTRKGKRPTVVATAIARELSAFIWAINRELVESHATANQ